MTQTFKALISFSVLLSFCCLFSQNSVAVQVDEMLTDPVLEARARAISKELRCPVCQNQSIDDSDASLAKDLRLLVRKRLLVGESNQQVLDFIVARYGEFVLLKPPVGRSTYLLWMFPLLCLGLGCFLVRGVFNRSPKETQAIKPLSSSEEEELKAWLND